MPITKPCWLGRGDFPKKIQKVSAFRKMAAVTVIRLSGYERILSCNEQLCRQSHLGGEHSKQFSSTHLPKIRSYMVPCGLLPCLMSSCNTYTHYDDEPELILRHTHGAP